MYRREGRGERGEREKKGSMGGSEGIPDLGVVVPEYTATNWENGDEHEGKIKRKCRFLSVLGLEKNIETGKGETMEVSENMNVNF